MTTQEQWRELAPNETMRPGDVVWQNQTVRRIRRCPHRAGWRWIDKSEVAWSAPYFTRTGDMWHAAPHGYELNERQQNLARHGVACPIKDTVMVPPLDAIGPVMCRCNRHVIPHGADPYAEHRKFTPTRLEPGKVINGDIVPVSRLNVPTPGNETPAFDVQHEDFA